MVLRERFDRGAREVDLRAGTDGATLARSIATALNGLAVQAASGATEKGLRQVAAVAMQARSCRPSTIRRPGLRSSVGSTVGSTEAPSERPAEL